MSLGSAILHWHLTRELMLGSNANGHSSSITPYSTFEARICIFYMSMQVIKPQVRSGLYSERILYSTTERKPTQAIPSSSSPVKRNLTFTYTPNCEDLVPEGDRCSRDRLKSVEVSIPSFTGLNVVAAIGNNLPFGNVTIYRQSALRGLQATKSLYQSPNITKTMHTIAHYMTVALRANDTILAHQNDPQNKTGIPASFVAPSHRVNGTVYVQAVLLRVRWAWLVFPFALVLIVAGLLFETIRLSQPEGVGVWKNNALAVLLNTDWRPDRDHMGAATSEEIGRAHV